jgi:hypothetical protein
MPTLAPGISKLKGKALPQVDCSTVSAAPPPYRAARLCFTLLPLRRALFQQRGAKLS